MDKRLIVLLSALCLLGGVGLCAARQASTAAPQPRKKRVAIIDFEYGTVRTAVASLFGTDVDVGRGISDLLVTDLVNNGTYTVVERQMLDKILTEQNFSASDRANPATAAKIGKILGVDAIIVGSITEFGGETKQTNIGGFGAARGPFGIGGFGRRKTKAIVGIDARLVDVDTGEILAVAAGKGESLRQSTALLGAGGSWGGAGGGAVDFGSKDFQQTIIGEAVKAAVDQLAANVIADQNKLQARAVVIDGLVADVEPDSVVLNVGANAGVKVGDQLSIEQVTREIKDPATGKVIRRLTTKIGIVQVTQVDDASAVAKIVSSSGFKVGDAARTVTQ